MDYLRAGFRPRAGPITAALARGVFAVVALLSIAPRGNTKEPAPATGVIAAEVRHKQIDAIELSIAKGTRYLVDLQQADGTWRSTTYGLMKDGTSLTPLVLWSLPHRVELKPVHERGVTAMSNWVGTSDRPARVRTLPQYPIYSAGLANQVLVRSGRASQRDQALVWRDLLITYQLNEANDWKRDDAQFGGWGYSHEVPSRPDDLKQLSPLDEPNLSATVFALEGLMAVTPVDDSTRSVAANALRFVQRCQNWRDKADAADAKFNDGGFHFVMSDVDRNKPGVAGEDSTGEVRFLSYGSATADGLRALRLCGLKPDHPRVVAAYDWLTTHFKDGAHPGAYPASRVQLQPSLDYYYAASLAIAFRRMHTDDPKLANAHWAMTLSKRLLQYQRPDGSWSNSAIDTREDDPLIATPFAVSALQICVEALR